MIGLDQSPFICYMPIIIIIIIFISIIYIYYSTIISMRNTSGIIEDHWMPQEQLTQDSIQI